MSEIDSSLFHFSGDDDSESEISIEKEKIPLPSQRKQMVNQNQKGKRPPKIGKNSKSNKLLSGKNNIDLNSIFDLNDEEKQNIQFKDESLDSKPSNINEVEKHLLDYLDKSINKIKTSFTDELSYLLNQESEQESILSAFLLGLPHDIEESVAEEVANLPEFPIQTYSVENLLSPLNILHQLFPCHSNNNESVNLTDLLDELQVTKSNLSKSITQSIMEVQNENQELTNARQQFCFSHETSDPTSSMGTFMTLCEKDAERIRIDIEYETIMNRKRRLTEMKTKWQESLNDCNQDDIYQSEIEKRFAQIANDVPRSQYCQAINSLKALVNLSKQNVEELKSSRKSLEEEIQSFSLTKHSTKPPPETIDFQIKACRKKRAHATQSIKSNHLNHV